MQQQMTTAGQRNNGDLCWLLAEQQPGVPKQRFCLLSHISVREENTHTHTHGGGNY